MSAQPGQSSNPRAPALRALDGNSARTLDQLAEVANREHAQAFEAASAMVQHAHPCG